MKKNNKYIFMLVIAFVIAFAIFICLKIFNKQETIKNMTIDQYVEIMKSSNTSYVYIYDSSVTELDNYNLLLEKLFAQNNLILNRIDIYNMSANDYNTLIINNEIMNKGEFMIPFLFILKDNVIFDYINGSAIEEEINDFISKNAID